jgi:UDPglucose 6-dehydrogenase/GDP-mannose 6-dehydrogenase
MKISVIGTGYVGLVSGVCLAELGHEVTCVDIDPAKVDMINNGVPPIHEIGLEALLKKNSGTRLQATTNLKEAVLGTSLSLIAVGTPFDGERIDLTYIRAAAGQIGEALRHKDTWHSIIVKSTVVPGTSEEVVLPALEASSGKKAGVHFGVGMNPEFLKEGEAVADFMNPDRIVMGGTDDQTLNALDELYAVFPSIDKIRTNCRTAEMIKYTANSLLATMISFSNEIGNLCAATTGVDVTEVMRGVHADKRLTPLLPDGSRIRPGFVSYLEAGCGFGGSCFPKDVKALAAHGKAHNVPMRILEAVLEVNGAQPEKMVSLLKNNFPALAGVPVSILGLAFKPGTDDIRESPAIPVINRLLQEGASVRAYDPIAARAMQQHFPEGSVTYCQSLEDAVDNSRAVLLMTRWNDFSTLPEMLRTRNPSALLIDGRRFIDRSMVANYSGIGIGPSF